MGQRDEYVAAMKTAFVSLGTRLAYAWAVSILPPLANPFLKEVFDHYASDLMNYLAKNSEMGIFFWYIDTRVGAQSKDFEAAAKKLHDLKEHGSIEEVKNAEEELWVAFKKFAVLTS